jgi:hypothetical protein
MIWNPTELGEHLNNDTSRISSVAYSSMIRTLPNQAQRLYRLLQSLWLIVVWAFMPLPIDR